MPVRTLQRIGSVVAGTALVMASMVAMQPVSAAASTTPTTKAQVWETNLASHEFLQQKSDVSFQPLSRSEDYPLPISVDANDTFQPIEGFGAALTDSSAWVIKHDMTSQQADEMFQDLFTAKGIHLNLLRLPMGASDMSASGNYSYDDMPKGKTDPQLKHFSIAHDEAYIIPQLRQIRRDDPALEIIASPWSPPAWMKTNDSMIGGSLKPSAYGPFAAYFVKFLQAYKAEGIPIQYITAQNEPLNETTSYPGMLFQATDEANFIANDLGPDLLKSHLSTKILAYDHNWDGYNYPLTVLGDSAASKYVVGTAWHNYNGDVSEQSIVHDAYPGKTALVTEASGGTWQGSNAQAFQDEMELVIDGIRNWGQGIVLWNLALNPNNGPTNNGCTTCRGVVTIHPKTGAVTKNLDYYVLGQASSFVAPGAHRMYSNTYGAGSIDDVAFVNPDGSKVLIAYNGASTKQTFTVEWGSEVFPYTLAPNAVATFTWRGDAHSGPPYIGAVSPTLGLQGGAVTVLGSGFGNSQSGSTIQIGGVPLDVTAWDDAKIDATIPDNVNLGAGVLSVTVNGVTSNAVPYPVVQKLEPSSWVATALISGPTDVPQNALDGNLGTRFSTGGQQMKGEWLQVDMKTQVTFNEIVLDSGSSTSDYARGYQVFVSNDGSHWGKPIASGKGAGPVETIQFATQKARYIKVVETAFSLSWWSVAELNVYNS